MPWQQQVADVALEVDEAGLFCYPLVIITVPRQSGKTLAFSAVMEHRSLIVPRARVWFCQQTGKDAVDWLINEHVPLLGSFGDEIEVRRAAGSEHVRWRRSGGMVRPFPPTPDALHSKTSDLVVVDEAWAFDLVRGRALDQAIVPTQATKPNAQVWKVSTAGDDASTWWLGSVEQGRAAVRAGRESGVAFFEWSCPDHLDPCEESSWPLFHPAYGRTIHAPAMRAALEQLGAEEFARAYGNRWIHTSARVIPVGVWTSAADADGPLPAIGGLSLGFDVALDRSDACIVAAWRDSGGVSRFEVADHRPGAGWVVPRLVELVERWSPLAVGYDAAGPALDIADEASRSGVTVTGLKAKEYAAACAALLETLTSGKVRYRPHPALDDAAASAGRRALGDAWAWGRRLTSVSLSPLTAATVALWSADHAPAPTGPFRVF
jgi:hypothetical protein